MNAPENFLEGLETKVVTIKLNGKQVEAKDNETILKVAEDKGLIFLHFASRMGTGKMVTVEHALSRSKEKEF